MESRIIVKRGKEIPESVKNMKPKDIIDTIIQGGKVDSVSGRITYNDYHGVGILDTEKFLIITETYPPRIKPYIWEGQL